MRREIEWTRTWDASELHTCKEKRKIKFKYKSISFRGKGTVSSTALFRWFLHKLKILPGFITNSFVTDWLFKVLPISLRDFFCYWVWVGIKTNFSVRLVEDFFYGSPNISFMAEGPEKTSHFLKPRARLMESGAPQTRPFRSATYLDVPFLRQRRC